MAIQVLPENAGYSVVIKERVHTRIYNKERHPIGCLSLVCVPPSDDREKKRAFFRPKTVKNHIPQFKFRHNTCICPKNIVSLHAVCVQKETTQQPN